MFDSPFRVFRPSWPVVAAGVVFPYCMLGGAGYNRFRQFTMHWLPNYGPTYYAAFVHDPEGNNIEAMLA